MTWARDSPGSGISSSSRPILLKFDRSLVADVDSDATKSGLITRLTSFADEVGMEVVAEGIETEAELDTLRALGVETGQGFLLGRPGPIPRLVNGTWEWPMRNRPFG